MTLRAAHSRQPAIRWTAPVLIASPEENKPRKWTCTAYSGGPMRPESPKLDGPLYVDTTSMQFAPSLVANLDHDETQRVGHVTDHQMAGGALLLSGVVSGGGDAAQEFVRAAEGGFPWQASLEADGLQIEKLAAKKTAEINGRTVTGPAYIARNANVYGVAFLGRGADQSTSVTLAAGAADFFKESETMKFTEWLAALGLEESTLNDAQKAKLQAKFDTEQTALKAKPNGKDDPEPPPPAFDAAELRAAYAKHEAAIEEHLVKCMERHVPKDKIATLRAGALDSAAKLMAQAKQHEWAAIRFEVEALKAQQAFMLDCLKAEAPQGPAIHSARRDVSDEVLRAAFGKQAGLEIEKHFKPDVLDAADKAFSRGIGLQQIILRAAAQNGYDCQPGERIDAGNIRTILQAAFSTHTLTTLLTTTGNKILLDGFMSIPQSWRSVAAVRTVNDFKTVTAFRMNASLEYEELGPNGEIKHGTVSQESYTMQAKTYAKMMALRREDIINDDLSAFTDLRQRLGLGAAIKMNKVFWTAWLAAANGAAFWTAARGNLVTSSALAEAGLNTAVKAFREMAAPDGNMMNIDPKFVLVPPALEATARKLYVSSEVRDTTSSTKFLVANIYQNMFAPIVVPELGNSSYTGYSATNWWLIADPAVLASAIMCFLNGQQSPTIETAEADFNTLGVQFRGYHDFGVAMTEYRASVEAQA